MVSPLGPQEHPALTFVQTLYRCRELGSGALARFAGAATLGAVKQGLAAGGGRRRQQGRGVRPAALQVLPAPPRAPDLPLKLRGGAGGAPSARPTHQPHALPPLPGFPTSHEDHAVCQDTALVAKLVLNVSACRAAQANNALAEDPRPGSPRPDPRTHQRVKRGKELHERRQGVQREPAAAAAPPPARPPPPQSPAGAPTPSFKPTPPPLLPPRRTWTPRSTASRASPRRRGARRWRRCRRRCLGRAPPAAPSPSASSWPRSRRWEPGGVGGLGGVKPVCWWFKGTQFVAAVWSHTGAVP